MKTRILCLLLACVLALPLIAACSSGGGEAAATSGGGNGPAATAPAETEDPRKTIKDSVPDGFSLNGQKIGLYCQDTALNLDVNGGGELSGDVVYDAVYTRNQTVENRLNCTIEVTPFTGTWQEYGTALDSFILAGDDQYQIVWGAANTCIQQGRDYLFQSMSDNKYLDFSEPWWYKESMEGLSYDGKHIRYLLGDINLTFFTWTGCVYVNKGIFEDHFGDIDEFYKSVIDRKWTYDKLREYSTKAYVDVNGNGTADEGDVWGCLVGSKNNANQMSASAKIRFLSRDKDGYYYVDTDVDRAVAFAEKIIEVFHNTTGIHGKNFVYSPQPYDATKMFAASQSLFFISNISAAIGDTLRNMESDFGMLPIPMLDEAQGDYSVQAHNSCKLVCVPVSCSIPEETGAVIEALCAESYRNVVEVFYETAMKSKYSRDSFSGQVIDIIRQKNDCEFVYFYQSVIGDILLLPSIMEKGENNYSSKFASNKDSVTNKLNDLVAKYKAIDEGN